MGAHICDEMMALRDIKPENVLIQTVEVDDEDDGQTSEATDDGKSCASTVKSRGTTTAPLVKLLDFGLSKLINPAIGANARTFVGTRAYLAP